MKIKLILISLIAQLSFSSTLTGAEFNQIIKDVVGIYQNEIEAQYGVIKFNIDWESDVENASVSYDEDIVRFSLHGGFPRKYKLTSDAYAITICHEIGHLLAGEPKVFPTKKYSAEAQADYFATSKCLPRVFNNDKNRALKAIADSISIYGPGASLSLQSSEIVEFTNVNDYPSGQCRIDTLMAGLNGDKRPACWFNDNFDFTTWNYIANYEYEEAQVVGTTGKVTYHALGCHVEVKAIDFYRPSFLSPIEESEIYQLGFNVIGKCDVKANSSFSGALSFYRGHIYQNLNPNDK